MEMKVGRRSLRLGTLSRANIRLTTIVNGHDRLQFRQHPLQFGIAEPPGLNRGFPPFPGRQIPPDLTTAFGADRFHDPL